MILFLDSDCFCSNIQRLFSGNFQSSHCFFVALSSPVFHPGRSSHVGLPKPQSLPQPKETTGLAWAPLSVLQPRNRFQSMNWGDPRARCVGLPSLGVLHVQFSTFCKTVSRSVTILSLFKSGGSLFIHLGQKCPVICYGEHRLFS